MSASLEARSEALRWAMSKDGGQRLEGLYSRAQVATLYHNVMDAEYELALEIDRALCPETRVNGRIVERGSSEFKKLNGDRE